MNYSAELQAELAGPPRAARGVLFGMLLGGLLQATSGAWLLYHWS